MEPGVSTLLQNQLGSTLLKRPTRVVVVTPLFHSPTLVKK